jgi:hypothetical protein
VVSVSVASVSTPVRRMRSLAAAPHGEAGHGLSSSLLV